MKVEFTSHADEVKEAFEAACLRALMRCGFQAEGYAKDLCPVDTGLLRNSITFALSGEGPQITSYKADKGGKSGTYSGVAPEDKNKAVYIGTNVEYGVYQELGTGAKNTVGGRPDQWIYKDTEGRTHRTGGHEAQPFLKPAIANHAQTYRNIIKDELKNG